ncbi:MAG: NTP transferase domain-containing protein [Deinococcales bacterium]|nr:NTP transferase domain-containing protein [Deinococcales bacterium]
MDLVCLAAGKGSRLGRLGSYLQKCMYPVGLKPFLQHTLEQLLASGVARPGSRLVLVVGHHAEQVRGYFGASFAGLELAYVEQEELNGTGAALRLAGEALGGDGPVVAWQADLFVTAALFAAVAEHPLANVVTLGEGHEDESPLLRATLAGERVTRVWEGEGPLLDVGLWKLERRLLPELERVRASNGEFRFLPNLQRLVDAGLEVGYVRSREWVHLGGTLPTPEENVRAVARRLWEEG